MILQADQRPKQNPKSETLPALPKEPYLLEEKTRNDNSIVLTLQQQSCVSELFKAIQDAVSFIQFYRTMSFRAAFSTTFTMSDVQSIYIKFEQQTDNIILACGSHRQTM